MTERLPGRSASLRHRSFRFMALVLVGCGVVGILELSLRIWEARQVGTQHVTSGFLSYHETLGWRLAPYWQGRHEYAGFNVAYTVDGSGFRRSVHADPSRKPTVLVVGDSFTFGIGVGDDETFVERLNQASAEGGGSGPVFANCAVPGYSTDQEILLAERELLDRTGVSEVIIAVCLANDLLDNSRPFPLQGHLGKPFFRMGPSGLELTNTPVPRLPQFVGDINNALAGAMLGPGWKPDLLTRFSHKSACARVIHRELFGLRGPGIDFAERHAESLALFWQLIERFAARWRTNHVAVKLLLLPGSSGVLYSDSPAGQYQRYIHDEILRANGERKLEILDGHDRLIRAFAKNRTPIFLRDGHLNAAGHTAISRLILDARFHPPPAAELKPK